MDLIGRRTPYQWQEAFYQDHDDQPFILLHNSGGGFVEGDSAELSVVADPGTRSLFSTTAATKFYKSESGHTSRDVVNFTLGEEAVLEYLPDEVIPFAHSRIDRATRLALEASARLFASEVISAGRVNYGEGELFAFASMRSEFEVRIGGRLALLDRMLACDADRVGALRRLWGGYAHMATVVTYAPDLGVGALLEDVQKRCEALGDDSEAGATLIGGVIFVRLLTKRVWQAHEAVYRIWEAVRPAVSGKAARRIRKP